MKTLIDTLNRDFALPKDPEILNRNILDTIETIENSLIYIGLGLVKIKTGKIFKNLGFKNISAYIRYLTEKTGKDRSSVYKWLQIGEIYTKYREELTEAGFNNKDSSTKLPYLERALRIKPEKEVYKNIVKMSQREFSDYARGIIELKDETQEEIQGYTEEIQEDMEHTFFYRGKEAVKVNKKQKKVVYDRLVSCVILAFNSLDNKGSVLAVHLKNDRELNIFEGIAKEAREKMRIEMKKRHRRRSPSIA